MRLLIEDPTRNFHDDIIDFDWFFSVVLTWWCQITIKVNKKRITNFESSSTVLEYQGIDGWSLEDGSFEFSWSTG